MLIQFIKRIEYIARMNEKKLSIYCFVLVFMKTINVERLKIEHSNNNHPRDKCLIQIS